MDVREIITFVSQNFSSEEIAQLCMELSVDYEVIPGTNKQIKARGLVQYMERRGRLSELETLCLQERPLSSTETPLSPPPPSSPTPQPNPLPKPDTPAESKLNPYTLTSLLHIFFDDDEQERLAKRLGEKHGRFHPTHQKPHHPLVEKLAEQDQLDKLRDAAQRLHPELPWSEASIGPKLIAFTTPYVPDTRAMAGLLTDTFPDRTAFDSFFRQHAPQFFKNTPPNSSLKTISRELVLFMQRRHRLPELLTIMQTAYPAEFAQYGPYQREEKEFEKKKREVKKSQALSTEAGKVITQEIIRREAAPDGFILKQTLRLNAKRGIKSIAWLPQKTRLLSLTFENVMQGWDINQEKELVRFQAKRKELISFVGPMPNEGDALLITGSMQHKKVCIQNLTNNKALTAIDGVENKATSVAISPDGEWAVTAGKGNSLQVWNLAKASKQTAWRGHSQEVTRVLMMPDGKQVVSGGKDQTIRIWSKSGKSQHTLTGHTDEIALLAVSPDGRKLASVQRNSAEIFIWDLPKSQRGFLSRFRQEEPQLVQKLTGHRSWITALSFAANGRFLATKSLDYTVRLWQCDTWKTTTQMMETRNAPIAFHPKRPFLATGGENGQVIRIWELVA